MTLYLYALTEPAAPAAVNLSGLQGKPVMLRRAGPIAAALTTHDCTADAIALTMDNLSAHESVVEALMRRVTVLPARFRTTFADEMRLEDALARHCARLSAGLLRVRGAVELGVRAMWREEARPPNPAATPTTQSPCGRQYMLAKLAAERARSEHQTRAEALTGALHDRLAELARDSTRKVLRAPDLPLSAAYLVPVGAVDAFRERVRELAGEYPDLRILCTGPWPPYHFSPALAPSEVAHV